MNNSRKKLGAFGEALAASTLEASGYRLVVKNYRCPEGEMDLIMIKEDALVFIEVKTRRGRKYGLPEESITSEKSDRLIRIAKHYLWENSREQTDWRIDVVAIEIDYRDRLTRMDHIENAVTGW